MINIIQSEHLKLKRTFTRKLVLFAPLFFVIFALFQKIYMPPGLLRPWQSIISLVYNWWPVVFIPFGIALFAALAESHEKKAGNYRSLRTHDINPSLIWVAKVITIAMHTLATTIVLIIAIIISGLITASGEIPWSTILVGGFTLWLTSLTLIPIQLWAAAWNGTFFSMAVGFAGFIAGVLTAPKPYWMFVPWSWPTRLMSPMIGVHPNGVLLEISDPLRDPSVIPTGIILSIVALIIFTTITAIWFNKREVK
jgi:ABC-2 type transport system permease protein